MLSERQFRPLRGRELGFVPQDPSNALNAVRTIGSQALEAAALLPDGDAAARRERVLETFRQVGLTDPDRVWKSYPHQLSGGMLQRVLIGLAMLPRPALIVADEPTSGLDVTIQKRILDLFDRAQGVARDRRAVHHPRPGGRRRAGRLAGGAQGRRGAGARPGRAGVRRADVGVRPRAAGRRPRGQPRPLPARPRRPGEAHSQQQQRRRQPDRGPLAVQDLRRRRPHRARGRRRLVQRPPGQHPRPRRRVGLGQDHRRAAAARPRAARRGRDHRRRSVGRGPLPRPVAHPPPPPAARLPEPVHLARPDLAAGAGSSASRSTATTSAARPSAPTG